MHGEVGLVMFIFGLHIHEVLHLYIVTDNNSNVSRSLLYEPLHYELQMFHFD